jgi:hypothetical protein
MSATSQVALPDALLREAASHASHLGVSTERWIVIALAERIRLEYADAEYFRVSRSPRLRSLTRRNPDRGGNNPPGPGDEFEG